MVTMVILVSITVFHVDHVCVQGDQTVVYNMQTPVMKIHIYKLLSVTVI
jgi:hypothetical protein